LNKDSGLREKRCHSNIWYHALEQAIHRIRARLREELSRTVHDSQIPSHGTNGAAQSVTIRLGTHSPDYRKKLPIDFSHGHITAVQLLLHYNQIMFVTSLFGANPGLAFMNGLVRWTQTTSWKVAYGSVRLYSKWFYGSTRLWRHQF
jgi:hypothetical protein